MNKWLFSVAFLLGVGVSASEAQFSGPPITNPLIRPGTGPNFGPFQGGGFGNPYGTPFGPAFGTGGYYGPILGNTAGFGQVGNGLGGAGGLNNVAGTGSLATFGGVGLVTPISSNVTGHPTRFNMYSQYFNNQGTALLTNVLTTQGGQPTQPVRGGVGVLNPSVGGRPQQGGAMMPNAIR